ncbi:hypothetical protein [Desulforamulus aeronauticus]|uniref:Uncharacterized protein n=1 Tax=Desulforamulus aeronauticus DSM 10349 TaxID=1121421 RepID=A0A1M6U171_9FIRM|nr:hypothetical protein [Desulforamulus aeronauticus]SHK62947.1 hypothetical protein SAMN02745123_02555 [Desulforamulus aeronauticus DSM 10349]
MFCQLDQVKDVLDIAEVVRRALLQEQPENSSLAGSERKACSLIFGLLLLRDYDVFIQEGVITIKGNEHRHQWLEVYLEGEFFVLDVTLSQWTEQYEAEIPEVVFLLKEDAIEEYGYGSSEDYEWQRDAAGKSLWNKVLKALQINQTVDEVLAEISKGSEPFN